jgi:hypothetical protein
MVNDAVKRKVDEHHMALIEESARMRVSAAISNIDERIDRKLKTIQVKIT